MRIFQIQNEDHSAKVVAANMIDAILIFELQTGLWPSLAVVETDEGATVLLPPPGFNGHVE